MADTKHWRISGNKLRLVQCPLIKTRILFWCLRLHCGQTCSEKKHLRARLAAHKNICQRFGDFKIAWKLYVGFCLHYREKLHSDFSLQPSGNIFGLKIVMSCSVVRQQRNKVGRDHMWITDYWHMTKCQEGHSGINFLYNKIKKRVEKIFLQSFFCNLTFLVVTIN